MLVKKLGELGVIFAGTSLQKIKSHNSINGTEISLLNWVNLKNILQDTPTNNVKCYNIDTQYYHRKEYGRVKYGDIIFPALPSHTQENIKFINKYNLDNCIYDNNVYIFRNKSNYDSKYIYILLKNHIFSKYIASHNYDYKHKIIINTVSDIEIPIISDNHIRDIISEYEQIEKLEKNMLIKKNKLNNKISELIN